MKLQLSLDSFNHTGLYQADLKTTMGDFIVKFDVGELAGGAIGMVLGAEYSHTSFDQLNDPESNAFKLPVLRVVITSMPKDKKISIL